MISPPSYCKNKKKVYNKIQLLEKGVTGGSYFTVALLFFYKKRSLFSRLLD
jgi:hypothetical protein